MGQFTVVGTSSLANASTGSATIPVPTGTQIGDLLVVGFWQGTGCEVTDSRLTTVDRSGIPSPYNSGAYGTATDLSDVTLTFTGTYPQVAIVLALTDVIGTLDSATALEQGGFPTDLVYSSTGGRNSSVAFVADFGNTALDVTVGASSTWTTQDHVGADLVDLRCFTYDLTDPIPELNVSYGVDTLNRGGFRLVFYGVNPVVGTTSTYMRQRQSPVRAPSRNRPPQVRQRQRPEVTT